MACLHAVERFAGTDSSAARTARANIELTGVANGYTLELLVGILQSVRDAYEAGHMTTLRELVHAELFDDMLDMASHLLEDGGYKTPAAVIAGSVLEEHLRQLAAKHGVAAQRPDGRPKGVELLSADLAKNQTNPYNALDHKAVLSLYGLRTQAAHGRDPAAYDVARVEAQIRDVRDLMRRYPA